MKDGFRCRAADLFYKDYISNREYYGLACAFRIYHRITNYSEAQKWGVDSRCFTEVDKEI